MKVLLVFLLCFFGLSILLKVPVGYSLGVGATAAFLVGNLPVVNMAQGTYSALDSTAYLAIPFFMIAGTIMEYSGISRLLLNLVQTFFYKIRGALGVVTIVTSALFGVLTGSVLATLSAVGRIVIGPMKEKGYRPAYIAALLAATSFLGILIPPSVPGIMYALAASCSVMDVWISTIIPGILFALGYIVINYFRHGKYEEKVVLKMSAGEIVGNISRQTINATPALLMPIIVFGGIYSGICTATEAGAVSCLYGIIYYLIVKYIVKNKDVPKDSSLKKMFIQGAMSTVAVTTIMIYANVATRAITLSGVTTLVSDWVVANISSKAVFLLMVNIIYLIMGTFLDINCSLLLMTPLLLPSAKALGVDPVHFGAITLVNLCVGVMTPPFAHGIFLGAKIAEVNFVEVVKEIWPFIIWGIVVIGLTTYIPWISLALI